MDASSILTALVSTSNIKNIGKASGASTADVKSVLTNAIPSLLSGASAQVNTASSASSFLQAISSHSGDSASKIDLADGSKILTHLLGSSKTKTINAISKASGVEKTSVNSILSAAAPLLLSVLGKQTGSSGLNAASLGSLLGGLSANNVGSLLTGLLGGASTASASASASKPSAKKDSKADGLSQAASLLGSLLK